MDSSKRITVSVHRQPQRSFLSSVGGGVFENGAGSRSQGASKGTTGVPGKKRDLSHLFNKIFKVLEERSRQNPNPGGWEESSEEVIETESEGIRMEEEEESGHQEVQDLGAFGVENKAPAETGSEPIEIDDDSQDILNPGEFGGGLENKAPAETGSDPISFEDDSISYSPTSPVYVEGNIKKESGKESTIWLEKPQVNLFASQRRTQVQVQLPEYPAPVPTQTQTEQTPGGDDILYYEAVFAKASTRKHKKMKLDGYIFITKGSKGTNVALKDPDGKTVESSTYKLDSENLEDGKIFRLGGHDVQISDKLPNKPFSRRSRSVGTNKL